MWVRSGKTRTDSSSLATSPWAGGCRKTGSPKVASVMKTSQETGSKPAQVGSRSRL